MYKLNNNLNFFHFFIVFAFMFNALFSFAAEEGMPDSQKSNLVQESSPAKSDSQNTDAMGANDALNEDDELHESDITTKIYRSTDNSSEVLEGAESELEPSLDVDVINKEDLISMQSRLKNKIVKRIRAENGVNDRKPYGNVFFPWLSFAVILILLLILMKVIKQIKI